jgi:[ribosomal protein S5]-alanine N-acetyltransferase
MKLIEISAAGTPAVQIHDLPPEAIEVGSAYVSLYRTVGFTPPWLGYFALENSVCIGTCGFKAPPENGRVEIAYFTFSQHVGRGYATRMARMLIDISSKFDPSVIVAAQTLPNESASTSILKRLGFVLVGSVNHPEDGKVWEWQLSNKALQVTRDART